MFGIEQLPQISDLNLMETVKDCIYFPWWNDYESESYDIHNIITFQFKYNPECFYFTWEGERDQRGRDMLLKQY